MSFEYNDELHEYRINGKVVPGVTEVLKDAGFIDYSKIPESIREFALQRGSYVHLACAMLVRGELDWDTVDEQILPYVRAFEAFLSDTGFKAVLVEKPLCSELWGYCGTLDLFGERNEKQWLIDIKSGVVPDWCCLQLAAYEELLPDVYKERPVERYGLALRKDGRYALSKRYDYVNDMAAFTAALVCYRYKQEIGRRI